MTQAKWSKNPGLWRKLKQKARELRKSATDSETKLWELLRNRDLSHLHFRRQHPLGRYIVDFYCARAKLVIEVDGGVHSQQKAADQVREDFLKEMGLRVIRFSHETIMSQTEQVLEQIVNETRTTQT